MNLTLGKESPVIGTYSNVTQCPQGLISILMAPISGFYDPDSSKIRAVDISLFILIMGGFLGNVMKTGAIDAWIQYIILKLKGNEEWMIPILMSLFAISGTVYGMSEESLPFYALLMPIMLGSRFDSMVSASTILLGSGVGILSSTINPFATIIAANAAGVPFTDGMVLRFSLLVISLVICVIWVMTYARRVRRNPSFSVIFDQYEENLSYFLGKKDKLRIEFTLVRKIILIIFSLTFVVMVYGMVILDWRMAQISAVFLVGAVVIGLVSGMREEEIISTFINGAKDLLGVALIVGIARSITVIMDKGLIIHTLLHTAENIMKGMSSFGFINVVFLTEAILSFLIPSSSSLAVLTIPIITPLADFVNVSRDLVITTYQAASGIVNLITPTSAVVMGGLSISRIPYLLYLRWVAPLLLILVLSTITILNAGVFLLSL